MAHSESESHFVKIDVTRDKLTGTAIAEDRVIAVSPRDRVGLGSVIVRPGDDEVVACRSAGREGELIFR